MKKMNIKNREVKEIVSALKSAAAAAIGLVALIIGIPAKIVLGVSGWMIDVAAKMVDGEVEKTHARVNPERDDILVEIADV